MATLRILSSGSNAHGQLAHDSFQDSHTFRPCVFASDNPSSPRHQLPGDRVISITCGANHTLLLLELDHPSKQVKEPIRELWGCGDGRKGQLGPNHLREPPQNHNSSVFRRLNPSILDAAGVDEEGYFIHAVAASWESTFIILRQKHEAPSHSRDIVIAIGSNDYGDLGVGITPTELKYTLEPRRVALEEVLEKSHTNTLSGFRVTKLAAGPHHVIATLQLSFQNGQTQVVVGWGASRHEQLGINSQLPTRLKHKPVRLNPFIPSPRILSVNHKHGRDLTDPVVTFALGNHHTVLLHHSGHVTGIGSNKKDQLGGLREKLTAKDVHCTWNGTYLILGVGAGEHHAGSPCLEWQIQATGSRDKGQLGHSPAISSHPSDSGIVGFPFDPTTHQLVDMDCGSEHVLALFTCLDKEDSSAVEECVGEVWGWGWNEHGNLGLGHTTDAHLPTMVWPVPGDGQVGRCVLAVWAGCGTSWIVEAHEYDGYE